MKKAASIMLIDDDDTTHFINKLVISQLNLANDVIIKMNGKEALEYLNGISDQEDTCPSLVLLDLSMPVLDGFDFLKEYKEHHLDKGIVIVVLTNSTNDEDLNRLEVLGNFHHHILAKPLTEDKLINLYHKYFPQAC